MHRAVAGYMVRSPTREVNFTIPFGGFDMMFSKGKRVCCTRLSSHVLLLPA